MKRALVFVGVLACSKHDEPAPAPPPRRVSPIYHPAKALIETPVIVPARPLVWDSPVMSPAELEAAIEGNTLAGRVVIVSFTTDTLLDQYDPATGIGHYRGHGVMGLDTKPVISFTRAPTIEHGELTGHAHFNTGYTQGTIKLDAAAWDALQKSELDDPLTMQMMIEIGEHGSAEEVPVIYATLARVRVVKLRAHEVYLEGTPTLGHPA